MRPPRAPGVRPASTGALVALTVTTSTLVVLMASHASGSAALASQEAAPTATTAQGALPTTLVAQVTNERGEAIGNQEVVVLVIDAEQQVAERLEATTSASGEARFENVAAAPGYAAWAGSVYESATYQGEPIPLTPGGEVILPLTVYTVSTAPATLHINVLHIIINTIEPGVFQAVQVMRVLNVGEQAGFSSDQYEGRPVGLTIPVPDGATSIGPIPQFSGLDVERLVTDGSRLLDLRPVPPGDHQIAVQYEILTDPDGGDLSLRLPYPTAQVTLLVGPGLGVTVVESDQLTELDPVSIPNQGEFANYESDVFDAGATLHFRLGPPSRPLSVGSWALLALAAALFAGALASMFSGRRPPAADDDAPTDQRQELIAQIARLDDRLDSGSIAEADYLARRSDLIARILEIGEHGEGTQGSSGG